MLGNIVTQSDEYRNFGFESLTSDERAEYDAWSDEANAGTRDSLPSDFSIDFDSMSTVDYLKYMEAQRPGSVLKDLWNAIVKDAKNVLKHSDNPTMRRTAQDLLECEASEWLDWVADRNRGGY